MKSFIIAFKLFVIMTLITGILYPLLITAIGQFTMPVRANGSIVRLNERAVGSRLIGQKFEDPKHFQSRPSAVDYNPLPSGGSNLGWISMNLNQQLAERRKNLGLSNGVRPSSEIPADLLFASASGLDPHISPDAARFQIDRILRARKLDAEHKTDLIALVDSHTEPRDYGFLGEPRVNVLMLNLALDSLVASVER